MELSSFVKSWASQFYCRGLGLTDAVKASDEEITTTYRKCFEDPAKAYLKTKNLSPQDASMFLTSLKSQRLYAALFVLPLLKPTADFTDWTQELKNQVINFKHTAKEWYCVCDGENAACMIQYVDVNGNILGCFPDGVTLIPVIPLNTHGVNGDVRSYLSSKNPVTMTDQETKACKILFKDSSELRSQPFQLINGSTEIVTALDLVEYPYAVRKLLSELPPAFIAENGNDVYGAALKFVSAQPYPDEEVKRWLEYNLDPQNFHTETITPVALDDETVKNYLIEKYGMNPDLELKALFSTPANFMRMDKVADKVSESGFDAVVQEMSDDPNYMSGTLDEIITEYCKEENLSLDCTIAQLIHYINYECTITPPTATELLDSYIKDHPDFDTATSVSEFMSGTKHTPVDTKELALEFLENLPADLVPSEYKRNLRNAVVNNTPVPEMSVEDFLEEHPELKSPKAVRTDLTGREQKTRDAAWHVVEGFRDTLMESDTTEKRLAGQTLLYFFLKVLYAGITDVDEDVEFLSEKISKCSERHVATILQEALDLYK